MSSEGKRNEEKEFDCPEANFVAFMTEYCAQRCVRGEIARLSREAILQYRLRGIIDEKLLLKIEKEIDDFYE